MILVDTSVWVDHLNRKPIPRLTTLLEAEDVYMHRFIYGEIALGSLKDRANSLALLRDIHLITAAIDAEVAAMIEWEKLFSTGIGYIDAHLLASAKAAALNDDVKIWTRDKRLHAQAERLGLAYPA